MDDLVEGADGLPGLADDEFKRASGRGRRHARVSGRALPDLAEEVRQSIRHILDDPFVAVKDSVRGFVDEVETDRLREVTV